MSRNNPTALDTDTTYDLETAIDQADGTVDLTGSNATTDTLLVVSQDAGNALGYGGDGGLLVAAVGAGNTSIVFQQNITGNEIAVHDDGTGNTTSIFETITTVQDNLDGSFQHRSENNTVTVISWCDLVDDLNNAPTDGSVCATNMDIPVLLDNGTCALVDADDLQPITVPVKTTDAGQTLNDAALQALCGAGSGVIGSINMTVNNAQCNPASPTNLVVSGAFQAALSAGSEFALDVNIDGATVATYPVDSTNGAINVGGNIGYVDPEFATAAVAGSVSALVEVDLRCITYTPSAGNTLTLGSWLAGLTITP